MNRLLPICGSWLASFVPARRAGTRQRLTGTTKQRYVFRAWCALVSAALVAVLAGCGGTSHQPPASDGKPPASDGKIDTVLKMPNLEGQTIVINTYGGTFGDAVKKAIVEPFEAATGAKVTVTTNCCDAFETQVKGGQFAGDVNFGTEYSYMKAYSEKGLLKSDPRLAQIAKARGLAADLYQGDAITHHFYAYALAWNTKDADNHPNSWNDFFDTARYTGTRGIPGGGSFGALEIARVGSGTPSTDVYPIDVDKAIQSLTTLRKNGRLEFYSNGADLMNKLGTGELDYSLAFSNRVIAGIKQGLPVDMTLNGAMAVPDGVAIPATAKNVDGAVAFIDFSMSPSVQAAFANASGLAPAYPQAADMVDSSMRKYMVTSTENVSRAIKVDNNWWATNGSAADKKYLEWKSGS